MRAWSIALIALFSLSFLLSARLLVNSLSNGLTLIEVPILGMYAVFITSLIAKLKYPRVQDSSAYPRRWKAPERVFDGIVLKSVLTPLAILSVVIGIAFGVRLARAGSVAAAARAQLAAQVAAAARRATDDMQKVSQYLSQHGSTTDQATVTRLLAASSVSTTTYIYSSQMYVRFLQMRPINVVSRAWTKTAKRLLGAEVQFAFNRTGDDSLRVRQYLTEHSPTSAERAAQSQLQATAAASMTAYARIGAIRPVRDIQLVNTLLLCATAILPTAWLMTWAWRWQRMGWCRENGRCLSCGYDLRASPDRCPECGRQFASAPTVHAQG